MISATSSSSSSAMHLSTFITAYTPPAAALDLHASNDNGKNITDENGPFGALRRAHPSLVSDLLVAYKKGHTRTRTSLDNSFLSWTLTCVEDTHLVVLANDNSYAHARDPTTEHTTSPTTKTGTTVTAPIRPGISRSAASTPFDWTSCTRLLPISNGGGEMGSRIRAFDWSSTSIGPPTAWSPTLLTILSIVLNSDSPATIYWGPDLLLLYNDAYIPVLGPLKHPKSLGMPMKRVWAEIWDAIGPCAERTLRGESCYYEDDFLLIRRITDSSSSLSSVSLVSPNGDLDLSAISASPLPTTEESTTASSTRTGSPCKDPDEVFEEAYFTWAYIPLHTLSGAIEGIYNPCHEATGKVRVERRLRTLCTLATRLFAARTIGQLLTDTCEVLSGLQADVPYVAAYTVQRSEDLNLVPPPPSHDQGAPGSSSASTTSTFTAPPITLILQDTVGIPFDGSAAPASLVIDSSSSSESQASTFTSSGPFPMDLSASVHLRELRLHDDDSPAIGALLEGLPTRGSVPALPRKAASLPVVQGNELVGVVLVYLCPAVPVDERMLIFLDLLCRQVSTSASMVGSYEHEVQKLEEMAALDRAKTAFFTNISHELRTPLTLILGPLTELLALPSSSLPEPAKQHLSIADRNARRLLRLVNNIMDFATAEAGRLRSAFQSTVLGPHTADLASAFRSAAELAGLEYSVDVKEAGEEMVWVDRDKWEKVVYNLLSNALKYTLKGRVGVKARIEAPTKRDGTNGMGRFVLEVSDTGVGIPRGEQGRVFEKFHRAVNADAGRRIEGTGIGLSFVRELVRAHGGEVMVESEVGKGSTFRVRIPLGKEHLPQACVIDEEQSVQTPALLSPGTSSGPMLGLGANTPVEGAVSPPVSLGGTSSQGGVWAGGSNTSDTQTTPNSNTLNHASGVKWADQEGQQTTPLSTQVIVPVLQAATQTVSEAETSSESASTLSAQDVVWQPLPFGNRTRARIIVADDNNDMRRYITSLLSKYCDVIAVPDGARALAELTDRRKEFDLVLSDDMMPHMTGGALLDALRGGDIGDVSLRTLPFIMISAKAGDEARMEGLARGADDYLSKPFKARELLLRVHTQLQAASLRNELESRVQENLRQRDESRESFTRLCERLQPALCRFLSFLNMLHAFAAADGNCDRANQKWLGTLGLDSVNWNTWGDKVHPDDVQIAEDAYAHAVDTQMGYANPIEIRILDAHRPGQYCDIIYDLQPEFSSDGSGGSSGELLGWVGVWSDISVMRALQRQAFEAERSHTAEAERNRELQEQFIDITCHELRNPLNAIYNSAALLGESLARIEGSLGALAKKDEGIAEREEFASINAELQEDIDSANTIVLCARHQKRITDDVLNVSKLSAGLITLVMGDFAPWDEVRNTVRMFRDEVSARGLVLRLERDPSLDSLAVDRVKGDSGRFIQVVVNLLSNAIKFTETAIDHKVCVRIGALPAHPDAQCDVDGDENQEADKHVPAWPEMVDQEELLPMCRAALDASEEEKTASKLWIYVAVADSGHGMTQEEQERVFKRFQQASPRTYGEFGGHGLGLYVSRMLVELHGGRIHLQSSKGIGTILRFFILVQRSNSPPIEPPTPLVEFSASLNGRSPGSGIPPVVSPPMGRRLRVLVVEDNLINQRVLVKLLTILQCDTHTCKDGQECVDLLVSRVDSEQTNEPPFDLILMDLEMPVLDGLSATRKIRELESDGRLLPSGSGWQSVPIVAVSGNARSEWTDRARNSGMDGFLRKPYNKAELQELLDRWRSGERTGGTAGV